MLTARRNPELKHYNITPETQKQSMQLCLIKNILVDYSLNRVMFIRSTTWDYRFITSRRILEWRVSQVFKQGTDVIFCGTTSHSSRCLMATDDSLCVSENYDVINGMFREKTIKSYFKFVISWRESRVLLKALFATDRPCSYVGQ